MSKPKRTSHPYNYSFHDRLDDVTMIRGGEGWAIFKATGEGAWWIIRDEGTMADFLDPDEDAALLNNMIQLARYDNEADWLTEVAQQEAQRTEHDRQLRDLLNNLPTI